VGIIARYSWFLLLLGAALILWRLFVIIRRIRSAQDADDWDTKLVRQLRARGMDPFQEHPVDFFMGLPDEQACTAVNRELEKEGFRVDVKAVPESGDFPFSLHASKAIRVNVEEMREHSRRFATLAVANRGRYDGWSGL
jgi:Regulator of ribonuclease activity B